MTAALIDTLIRVEPASTGTGSSRPGAAKTSFDEVISDAVAQADDGSADRERATKERRHRGHGDDDKGRRAAETGLSAHLSTTVEHRSHHIGHLPAGSPPTGAEVNSAAQRGDAPPASSAEYLRHGRATSVTSVDSHDAPLRHAVTHHADAEAVRSGEAAAASRPEPAARPETAVRPEPAARPETAVRPATPGTAPLRQAAAAAPDHATPPTRPHRTAPTSGGHATTDAKAVPAAATPAETPPTTAPTTVPTTAKTRPTATDKLTGTEAERPAATGAHSAMRNEPTARETSYLKATARPTQAGPTVTDAPVIPAHLPAASATTINSTPVAAPAAPTAPVPLAQPDVAAILASLRGGPDGTYQLRAQVHPAELGSVNITATVAGGTLTVLLTGDTQAHHALSQALPQLRAHLADQGFTGVDVGLGSPDQQAGQTGSGNGEHHTQGSDHPLGTDIGPDGSADSQPTRPLRRAAGAIDTML